MSGALAAECARIERWLDDGRPAGAASAMLDHAAACARCARALAAAEAIERLLERPAPAARAGFDDAVMRAIAHERAIRAAAALEPAPALPLAVRIAAQPSVALAGLLAAVLAWRGEWLWAAATRLPDALATATPTAGESLPMLLGLHLWIALGAAWGAWALGRRLAGVPRRWTIR